MQRIQMNFATTDTGRHGDTGPSISGELAQVAWHVTDGDTGGGIVMSLLPVAGDTGDGFDILSNLGAGGNMAVDFHKVPRQPGCGPDGRDTGVDEYHPIVAAGDRLRAKVRPGDTGPLAGRLYIWIR